MDPTTTDRWELLDSAEVPGAEQVLSLHRRGDDFAIFVDHHRLMDSRVHTSELALAELGCGEVADRDAPSVLIGGLGMGLTLRAALDALPATASVDVAELVPAVVRWNRDQMADVSKSALDDPRVSVHESDVGEVMRRATARWDAILLDVDNGPEGLTRAENDSLYTADGLAVARAALAPNGVLAVWSAKPNDAFTKRLEAAGFDVRVEVVHSGGLDRSDHVIWLSKSQTAT